MRGAEQVEAVGGAHLEVDGELRTQRTTHHSGVDRESAWQSNRATERQTLTDLIGRALSRRCRYVVSCRREEIRANPASDQRMKRTSDKREAELHLRLPRLCLPPAERRPCAERSGQVEEVANESDSCTKVPSLEVVSEAEGNAQLQKRGPQRGEFDRA